MDDRLKAAFANARLVRQHHLMLRADTIENLRTLKEQLLRAQAIYHRQKDLRPVLPRTKRTS